MNDTIINALNTKLKESYSEARKSSIYSNEGRIFLVASADFYGYSVNSNGEITDSKGKKLDPKSADYQSIIESAKKQANNESQIGRNII